MNTSEYISSDSIMFMVTALTGDKNYTILPKGFYLTVIQDALKELNMDSFFEELREDIKMPVGTLTIDLPKGCFNVKNIYVFTGDECTIQNSKKIWWKRNYYTKGQGYIANDKGNNGNDPYYGNHNAASRNDKDLIRIDAAQGVNSALYYNIQMGKIMLSSSCRNAGQMIHVHYNGIGGDISEAPIIPVYFKQAIIDYVVEYICLYRMGNEVSDVRRWTALLNVYSMRLDKNGFNGSWHTAIQRVRDMNSSQREELKEYCSRGGWATGA